MTDKFNSHEIKEKSAAEIRKMNKPLMEKKRRERINNSLNQLKNILMDATKKDSSYYSKLEKADILEMTVAHLKVLRDNSTSVSNEKNRSTTNYAAGYNYCLGEVHNYLGSINGLDQEVKRRLLNHMNDYSVGDVNSKELVSPLTQNTSHININTLSQRGADLIPCSTADFVCTGTNISQFHAPNKYMYSTSNLSNNISDINSLNILPSPQEDSLPKNMPVLPIQLLPAKLPNGMDVFIVANIQNSFTTNNSVAVDIPFKSSNISSAVSIQGDTPNTSNFSFPSQQNIPFIASTNATPTLQIMQPGSSTFNFLPSSSSISSLPVHSKEDSNNKNMVSNTTTSYSVTEVPLMSSTLSGMNMQSCYAEPVFSSFQSKSIPQIQSSTHFSDHLDTLTQIKPESVKSATKLISFRDGSSTSSNSSKPSIAIVAPNLHINDCQERMKYHSSPMDLSINTKRNLSNHVRFLAEPKNFYTHDMFGTVFKEQNYKDEPIDDEDSNQNDLDSDDSDSVWRPWSFE